MSAMIHPCLFTEVLTAMPVPACRSVHPRIQDETDASEIERCKPTVGLFWPHKDKLIPPEIIMYVCCYGRYTTTDARLTKHLPNIMMRRGRFDVTVLLSQTPNDSLTKANCSITVQIACTSSIRVDGKLLARLGRPSWVMVRAGHCLGNLSTWRRTSTWE